MMWFKMKENDFSMDVRFGAMTKAKMWPATLNYLSTIKLNGNYILIR